jgi:hypothetical protein
MDDLYNDPTDELGLNLIKNVGVNYGKFRGETD